MILSRSRSPKRRHQDETASSLLFFFGHCRLRASAMGEQRSREKRGMTGIFFTPYLFSCVSISLPSALFHNSDGVTGLFSLNNVPYFLWRSLKKRFCESVSLRDGSVLFHRRVSLEWNVLRPEFFLHLGVIR